MLFRSDSELIIKQMNDEYKVKSINILQHFKNAIKLTESFNEITFTHVYRNNNVRADELANNALL